jgi:molybdenum cofactor biosynthesis protein B
MQTNSKNTVGIIVVSDRVYKGERPDESGKLSMKMLSEKGFQINHYSVVTNDEDMIRESIKNCLEKADVCITLGGTGPSPRDKTIEVASSLSTKYLPGYGEIFRKLTYESDGATKAIATRTELFVVNDKLLLCLPGSPSAVKLGITLLLDGVEHVLEELKRTDKPHRNPASH